MKRTFTIILVFMLCISMLAGCGSKDNGDKPENPADSGNNVETAEKAHSTGAFSFIVPKGWLEIPFSLNGEPNPKAAGIYKGAKSEFDMITKPGIQINCPSSGARISANKNSFSNVSELTPLKLANYTWEGFTGEINGVPHAILWDTGKKDDFQVTVCLEQGEKISLTDADVLSILASIKLEGGDDKDSAALEGKYQMTVYEINGENMFEFFASMFGEDFDAEMLYVEFKSGGKCVMASGDEPLECTYKLDGNAIEIDLGDEEIMKGTITADTVTIEDKSDGNTMLLVFVKGAAAPVISQAPSGGNGATAVQKTWNGVWYGYMWLTEFYGAYEDSEDDFFDAFMEIDVDENGEGMMTVYMGFEAEFYSFDELSDFIYLEANIIADEHHFEVTEGEIYDDYGDMSLDPADWWIGLSPLSDEFAVIMTDIFLDDDDDGFEFIFTFRPYGSLWEDQLDGGFNKKVPPGYDDYIAELDGEVRGVAPEGLPPGGDGLLNITTYRKFKEILDAISDLAFGLGADPVTYEDVVEHFDGVEGRFEEDFETYVNYQWFVANGGGGGTVMFDKKDGKLIYSGYSSSEYTTP